MEHTKRMYGLELEWQENKITPFAVWEVVKHGFTKALGTDTGQTL